MKTMKIAAATATNVSTGNSVSADFRSACVIVVASSRSGRETHSIFFSFLDSIFKDQPADNQEHEVKNADEIEPLRHLAEWLSGQHPRGDLHPADEDRYHQWQQQQGQHDLTC